MKTQKIVKADKPSQKTLIRMYLRTRKKIVPALVANSEQRIGNKFYWFGVSVGKRCRELRKENLLDSDDYKHNGEIYTMFFLKKVT